MPEASSDFRAAGRLADAVALRGRMGFPGDETDAFRVVDGAGDGMPGLFIDSFAGHWLVQTLGEEWPAWLEDTRGIGGWRSLSWKRLERQDRRSPEPMAGEVPDGSVSVRELGWRYEIDFRAGYSQGLFIDQRVQKEAVRQRVRPGDRVLNLFAYTCAFSVVAAGCGAVTTSVDLSRPFLEWGKRNFAANGLAVEEHYFCRGDAGGWLPRFAAKGRSWHGMVLDPPTFSRNDEGRVWRVERDLGGMVADCLRVLEPGGWLQVSANHRGLSESQFRMLLADGARLAGRAVQRWEPGAMPPDFRGENYLRVMTMVA
jgi:23S rRNA (cytosine1962-C5)-methyltransferase